MDLQANRSFTKSDLECLLLDEAAEPKALPFSLLENITNGFSYKQEIGRGGFAVVYMGMLESRAIAVKKLSNTYKYENEFLREVECLMKVKHKNIVRFLGYCSDTQGHVGTYNGKFVMVDLQEKLLCFEYLPKGSLDIYIKDISGGLEWKMCYGIIKGICEGLQYLHSINIMHLDLKPSNILLDDNMVPKITDFGLSRSLEEMQTRFIATKMFGTIGYLAPEFTSRVVTRKFDLYSLGVIILEILTGDKACQDVENVLEIWESSSELSQGNPRYEQIRVCAEIGIECTNIDPTKRPVSMTYIMDRLAETERTEVFLKNKMKKMEVVPVEHTRGLLKFQPLELPFPFKHNMPFTCALSLTNSADEWVAFRLKKNMGGRSLLGDAFRKLLLYGIVPPMSTYTLLVTTAKEMNELPAEIEIDLILHTCVMDEDIHQFKGNVECDNFLEKHGDALNRVTLKAFCDPQKETTSKVIPHMEFTTPTILRCLDAHPTEPWITIGDHCGNVHVWNYDIQSIEHSFKISATLVWSIKIVARKQWVLAGDFDCYIHVYYYGVEPKKIRSFKGASSLYVASMAIHPTKSYVLSATYQYIDLWDWDNNWKCIHTFEGHSNTVHQVAFNPRDHNSFVSASWDNTVKVWSLNSPESSYTLSGHSGKVICLDFFTRDDQQYLITGSSDSTAKIWDMQEKTCIHTIECFPSPFSCVISLPGCPYLVTGSKDGLIRLWNSSDYRLERIFDMGMLESRHTTEVGALVSSTVSNGFMVMRDNVVAVLDINDYEPVVTQGDNERSI